MNSKRIYDEIILHRQSTPIEVGYKERHHILPRSLGGADTKENLVKLTAREHFICHLLLTEIYRDDQNARAKMVKAFCMMMLVHGENQRRYITSHLYARLKEENARIQSLSQTGKGNSQFGTICITNGIENRRIKKEQEIPEGWRKGAFYPFKGEYKKKFCNICNKIIDQVHLRRQCSEDCRIIAKQRQITASANASTKANKERVKSVICCETQEIFQSQGDAARALGIPQQSISNVLRGKAKSTHGLTFQYCNKFMVSMV